MVCRGKAVFGNLEQEGTVALAEQRTAPRAWRPAHREGAVSMWAWQEPRLVTLGVDSSVVSAVMVTRNALIGHLSLGSLGHRLGYERQPERNSRACGTRGGTPRCGWSVTTVHS